MRTVPIPSLAMAMLLVSITPPLYAGMAPRAILEIEAASNSATESAANPSGVRSSTDRRGCPDPQALDRLERAIDNGKEINDALRSELEDYKRIQGTLTSGLIGALVTAIVAVASAILSARNSRPERDLKRLAVIEKARELAQQGQTVPADIASQYGIQNK